MEEIFSEYYEYFPWIAKISLLFYFLRKFPTKYWIIQFQKNRANLSFSFQREIFQNQNENPNYSRENYSKIFLEKEPKKEFDYFFSPYIRFEGKKARLQISSKYKQIKTKFDRIWCKQYPYQSLLVLITDQGNVRSWGRPPNYPSENISTRSDGSITNIYDVRERDIDEDQPTSQTKVLEGRREKGTRGTQYIIDWH